MARQATTSSRLACCHGYRVTAGGRLVGFVETPVFAAAVSLPDHLIVRTTELISGTFRVVPASLVTALDPDTACLTLGVGSDAVAGLPERLPLGRR